MKQFYHTPAAIEVTFDDENLVANAGLLLVSTLASKLGLADVITDKVDLTGRVGGANPASKSLTLIHAMVAGASHIDHVDMLRAGASSKVLPFHVVAPSTLGTYLRSFTFGHVRQLDEVIEEELAKAWSLGMAPGDDPLVIDIDSTICEVSGYHKQGAAYGYTKKLGYHPILAVRSDTGEVLHCRMRKGSANTQRGTKRFVQ
ncbi:transposase, partial [Ferrimicrobium acidiphilum]|uniref:transposase n=1 Tax=Ferrimicrobium acidiphilum TaxID=121039 RepID=UPI0023F335D1